MTAAHQFEFSTQAQWEQDTWYAHCIYGTQKTYDTYVAAVTALYMQGEINHNMWRTRVLWATYKLDQLSPWWKRLWRRLKERLWRRLKERAGRLFVQDKSS